MFFFNSYVDIVHVENNIAQVKSNEFNGGSVEANANPDVWNNVDAVLLSVCIAGPSGVGKLFLKKTGVENKI